MATQSQKSKDKAKDKATPKVKAPKQETERKLAPVQKTEAKQEEKNEQDKAKEEAIKLISTTDCKVFGSPDPNHKKCRTCKDLDNCLLLQASQKKAKTTSSGTKKDVLGRDFIGFQKGSKKSLFALTIAKKPCTMSEIKTQPWNAPTVQTFYDAFNELRRYRTKDGEWLPLAAKDKSGLMFIVEKNLTREQREQMKAELDKLVKS